MVSEVNDQSAAPASSARAVQRVTIADVARAAGVSKAAVSYALNGRPGVSEETRALVLSSAQSLGWTPNLRARSISLSRAHALGLVIGRSAESMGDPFLYRSIAGIQEVIAPLRLVLVQALAGDEATELETYRTLAHDGRVDGVFLIDLRTDDPRVPLLGELGLPSVTLGPSDRPDDALAGGSDITTALTEAVRELIAFGHTRIAFVSGPARLVHTAHRAEVIAHALRDADLPAPVLEVGDYSAQSGAECTGRILAHRQRPTAILYANDVMAIGGMSAALDLGYRIPGDLSVLGMGDIELAGHVHPGLTSIRTDSRAIGAAAAHRLIARIERDYVVPDGRIPAPELVRRGSVGPAADA